MDATGKVQLSESSDAAPLGVTMAYTTGLISKQEKNKLKFLLFEWSDIIQIKLRLPSIQATHFYYVVVGYSYAQPPSIVRNIGTFPGL